LKITSLAVLPDIEPDGVVQKTFSILIPEDAKEGEYSVLFEIEYDEGYKTERIEKTIYVEGEKEEKDSEEEIEEDIISVQSGIELSAGEESSFLMSITNLGKEERSYQIKIVGTQLWAESWTDPNFISIRPGETKKIVGYIRPYQDAEEKVYQFSVEFISDGKIIEKKVVAKVEGEKSGFLNGGELTGSFIGFKKNENGFSLKAKITFIVLIALAIITAIFVGYRKLIEIEESEEPKKMYY